MVRRIGFGDNKDGDGAVRRGRAQRNAEAEARKSAATERTEARRADVEERRKARDAARREPAQTSAANQAADRVALAERNRRRRKARVIALIILALVTLRWLGGLESAAFLFEGVWRGYIPPQALLTTLAVPLVALALILLLTRPIHEAGQPSLRTSPGSPRDSTRAEREAAAKLSEGVEQAKGCGRVFIGLFLFLWLSGWTTGIVFAFLAFIDDGAGFERAFLGIWLTAAVIGWVVAARKLWQIVTGRDVENVKQ